MSSVAYNCSRLLRQSNLVLSVLGGPRIPRTSQDPPFNELPMLSGGSLGHPGILPSCPLRHRPPCLLSGGSLGHPRILPRCPLRHRPPCCPEDPLDISRSSLGVPSDTGPHAVQRIPWTSRDPPSVSPQTQAPKLCGRSLGHPRIPGLPTS